MMGFTACCNSVRSLELCAAHSINLTDEQLDRLRTRKALVKERSLRHCLARSVHRSSTTTRWRFPY